jgi:hypothetical protein
MAMRHVLRAVLGYVMVFGVIKLEPAFRLDQPYLEKSPLVTKRAEYVSIDR